MSKGKQGFIYIVKEDMPSKGDYKVGNREVIIKKGEIVEFRFHSPCHFRTQDKKYFEVSEEDWNHYCIEIGKIWDKVYFNNKADLEEIWRLKLFDWTNQEAYELLKQKGDEEC